MLNGFCSLSEKSPISPALNGQYQDEWNTKQNRMKNTPPFYIVFQVLQVILINICRISHQIFYFLLFYVSFDISRHYFLQIIRTSYIIIWKKDFCHKLSFFNWFAQTPAPPYRPKSAKRDKDFFVDAPLQHFFFSEQEPPQLFLPNGAKLLRLAHEPSQNLIWICQFVTTLL